MSSPKAKSKKAPAKGAKFDTERLYRRVVIQVEAPTRKEAEEAADALDKEIDRLLTDGAAVQDHPEANFEYVHEQDVWHGDDEGDGSED
jgi:hypothetical protein